MSFQRLDIHSLRNFEHYSITFDEDCTVIFGQNGSGKTTILEALYLLTTAKSFRTHLNLPLIHDGRPFLALFAETTNGKTFALQKARNGKTQVKIDGANCASSSELVRETPVFIFYQDIFQIIDAGPGVRRQLLNWGMFHVKHSYLDEWKKYNYILKQRNALLRQKKSKKEFAYWNQALASKAEDIFQQQRDYIEVWKLAFEEVIASLHAETCSLALFKGWDRANTGEPLLNILDAQFDGDMRRQYTQSGSHQADLLIESSCKKAKHVMSRGQQKIILFALKLAQTKLLDRPCLYLFDDMSSELDSKHLKHLVRYTASLPGQKVYTSIEPDNLQNFFQSTKPKLVALTD